MNEKHYREKLSAFVNHELTNDERQAVAGHLLQCAGCRTRHDEIKFGAALANRLEQSNAPENLWNKIETALDGKPEKVSLLPSFTLFNLRGLTTAVGLLLLCGLVATVYFGLLKSNAPETAKNETAIQNANFESAQIAPTPDEVLSNRNTNAQIQNADTNSEIKISPNANSNIQALPTNSKVQILPKKISSPAKERNQTIATENNLPAWNVETITGTPRAGNQTISQNGKLAVGETLETDADSRARVEVADIGQVEIAPNSRVQLVNTNPNEHRLSLKKGILQAKIFAPPRLFIVDTPSAVAVDLGCEYTLEVDEDGNSKLHVTSGFVALENGRYESIVPAGALALTKKGVGIGTPFAEDSSLELQTALYKFDFQNGGGEALQTIIKEANLYDSLTLWHLLSRVSKADREKVFAALAAHVAPPENVTRTGVLRLDKKMLDLWWQEIEQIWFG